MTCNKSAVPPTEFDEKFLTFKYLQFENAPISVFLTHQGGVDVCTASAGASDWD